MMAPWVDEAYSVICSNEKKPKLSFKSYFDRIRSSYLVCALEAPDAACFSWPEEGLRHLQRQHRVVLSTMLPAANQIQKKTEYEKIDRQEKGSSWIEKMTEKSNRLYKICLEIIFLVMERRALRKRTK